MEDRRLSGPRPGCKCVQPVHKAVYFSGWIMLYGAISLCLFVGWSAMHCCQAISCRIRIPSCGAWHWNSSDESLAVLTIRFDSEITECAKDSGDIMTSHPRQCLWCCRHDIVIARVHPVHLMNADWALGGRQPSDQTKSICTACFQSTSARRAFCSMYTQIASS